MLQSQAINPTSIFTFSPSSLHLQAFVLFQAEWRATTFAFHCRCCGVQQMAELASSIASTPHFSNSLHQSRSHTHHSHFYCCTASPPGHSTYRVNVVGPIDCYQRRTATRFTVCVQRWLSPFNVQSDAFSQPPLCQTFFFFGPSPTCKPGLRSTQFFCLLIGASPSTSAGSRRSTNSAMIASPLTSAYVCELSAHTYQFLNLRSSLCVMLQSVLAV